MKTIRLMTLMAVVSFCFGLGRRLHPAFAAGVWYVADGGSDSGSCASAVDPCATINGAVAKAADGDTIKVAVGAFPPAIIAKNIIVSGGWDAAFNNRIGYSTIDGGRVVRSSGVDISAAVTLEHFIVQNCAWGIYSQGDATLRYLDIRNNGTGIMTTATMQIESSRIHDNACGGCAGGGIYNWAPGGTPALTISNSAIDHNQAGIGGGIFSRGELFLANTTISNNTIQDGGYDYGRVRLYGGGGIFLLFAGDASFHNVTITENDGAYIGGGIHVDGTSIVADFQNSIVAGNIADDGPDCFGPITSHGHNLISRTVGCEMNALPGDWLDVPAGLGPLAQQGGETPTHGLYRASPAVDGGDPDGCRDRLGALLQVDQRGEPRPADADGDGVIDCDIGAYEAGPGNLIPPSPPPVGTNWYVRGNGDDNHDCRSPSTACATINAAIQKASAADIVNVSADTYRGSGAGPVVYIGKSVTLSGGWDAAFTWRPAYTILDGEQVRRGMVIGQGVNVDLVRFQIQNGYANNDENRMDYNGGGVFVGRRATVAISSSIIQNNVAAGQRVDSASGRNESGLYFRSGAGLYIYSGASVTLTNTAILDNLAEGGGGGIYHDGLELTVNRCRITGNTAGGGGGAYGGGVFNFSDVSQNTAVYGGGGIASSFAPVTLQGTSVRANTAIKGGGIFAFRATIIASVIEKNTAETGGGISVDLGLVLAQSTVIANQARQGGGIQVGSYSIIVNSLVEDNIASDPSSTVARGGGIDAGTGYVELYSATIAGNRAEAGGGIYSSGSVALSNTVVAANQAPVGPDCSGALTGAYNLIGNTADCSLSGGSGNLLATAPGFSLRLPGALAYMLSGDSPAIDFGDPGGCRDHAAALIGVDYSGGLRLRDGNGDGTARCDIGAFEYNPERPLGSFILPVLYNLPE